MPCESLQNEAETTEQTVPVFTRPNYSEKFKCIAGACEDTCCGGWTIPVDAATFQSYRSDHVLQPFTQLFVVNPTPTQGNVASMPLTHGGRCAFLDDRKLCSIQQNFGHQKLSTACGTYPREISYVSGIRETALDLSCPEAARLTLMDTDLLGPAFLERNRTLRLLQILHEADELPQSYQPHLATREFVLLLLTDRALPLEARLQRIGSLACALQSLADANELRPGEWVQRNPGTLARLFARILLRSAHPSSELTGTANQVVARGDFKTKPSLQHASYSAAARQLEFASSVLRGRLAEAPVSTRFRAVLNEVEQGLSINFADPLRGPATLNAYISASQTYLVPFLAQHPYVLENYIANHIFKYQFPFGRQPENPDDLNLNHLSLCTQVALLQALLIGEAAFHRENLDLRHVVTLVQTLARAVEHRKSTVDAMAELAIQKGLSKPASMAGLLALPA